MATFNQQGQTVTNQYNAENINFGQVQTKDDFFQELKQLQAELEKAIEAKSLTGGKAIDAQTHVKKAILQAEKEVPDKKTLIEHLTSAKELVTSIEGLATVFASAISVIGALF